MHRTDVILIAVTIAWIYTKTTVVIDADTGKQIGVIVTWQADDTEGTCLREAGRVPWLEQRVMLTPAGSTPWTPVSGQHACVWSVFGRGK